MTIQTQIQPNSSAVAIATCHTNVSHTNATSDAKNANDENPKYYIRGERNR